MAVFTPVSRSDLELWMQGFDLGRVVAFEGISSGIENSNFFVTTQRADGTESQYVLTLFERLAFSQLPFYLNLMHHLAARGIPCPDPVPDRAGRILGRLGGKPATLVTRLAGASMEQPTAAACRELGTLLARMHLASQDYAGLQPNLRGLDWWKTTAPKVRPHLDAEQAAMLDDELKVQKAFAGGAESARLPRSAVHADLFRDNVLWSETGARPRIGGVIDFYFAGRDSWLFDLAVTANDWCVSEPDGHYDDERLDALLRSYQTVRPLTEVERRAWPTMQRAAALRFWLSRLHDLHQPRPAELVVPKDPTWFERVLTHRREMPHRFEGVRA